MKSASPLNFSQNGLFSYKEEQKTPRMNWVLKWSKNSDRICKIRC